MLDLVVADDLCRLADDLVGWLEKVNPDPMVPEWVGVPSAAMRRWLELRVARVLGASAPARKDGVAFNFVFEFPGALRREVLLAGAKEAYERWRLDRLVWALMEIIERHSRDAQLSEMLGVTAKLTAFDRARRVADLFDRYGTLRPGLLRSWAAGDDVEADGRPLAASQRWQALLFRLVRAYIGVESPAERMPSLLEEVRAGAVESGLPGRIFLFGVTTLPGGPEFLELLSAVSAQREVYVHFLDPSLVELSEISRHAAIDPFDRRRARAKLDRFASHPLLSAWGAPYRERTALLGRLDSDRETPKTRLLARDVGVVARSDQSLLRRIQHDVRNNLAPTADFECAPGDRSVQIHECYGTERQVEVLRDALLHLLDEDETLLEEEIFVLCPSLSRLEPVISAVLGAPGDHRHKSLAGSTAFPVAPIRYRIADRSLKERNRVAEALSFAVELLTGRFEASSVLEFCDRQPVRRRFGFDDDDIAVLTEWIQATNIRWGLNAHHRSSWNLPSDFETSSFHFGVRSLLLGMGVRDGFRLTVGDIPIRGVEGDGIDLLGRFASLLGELTRLEKHFSGAHVLGDWIGHLDDLLECLFFVEDSDAWQLEHLRRLLRAINESGSISGRDSNVTLVAGDIRRMIESELSSTTHLDFFRGGVTFSSFVPLRWIPARVVAILDIDGAEPSFAFDGDDLLNSAPELGDRDPGSEFRQGLLEAMVAASDHLVITRSAVSLGTNQEIPPSTIFSELVSAIQSTIGPKTRARWDSSICVRHPRQSHDDRNFVAGALAHSSAWSFDQIALEGAKARRKRSSARELWIESPLSDVRRDGRVLELEDVRSFLRRPTRYFLEQRLGARLRPREDAVRDDLSVDLNALDGWTLLERALERRVEIGALEGFLRYERRRGTLAPGRLGDQEEREVVNFVRSARQSAAKIPRVGINQSLQVDVQGASGERIVGRFPGEELTKTGSLHLTASRRSSKLDLQLWLDLLLLAEYVPDVDPRAVLICRGKEETSYVHELALFGNTASERKASAQDGLHVVLDCMLRANREPIPLFPELGRKLAPSLGRRAMAKANDWVSVHGASEGDQSENCLVFGQLSLEELLAMEARPGDPGQGRSRVRRYAEYLWWTFDRTARVVGSNDEAGDVNGAASYARKRRRLSDADGESSER